MERDYTAVAQWRANRFGVFIWIGNLSVSDNDREVRSKVALH